MMVATELVVRSGHLAIRDLVWAVATAITLAVTAAGCILINRYRSDSPMAPRGATLQHDGVQS